MTASTTIGQSTVNSKNGVLSRRNVTNAFFISALAVATIADAANSAQAQKSRFRDRQPAVKKEPSLPQGPLLIAVNIGAQRVSLYANGELVTRASISTGTRGHPTPTGIFSVIQKNKWHRSNIYSGAPMPYMQRITWSGIALHQGPLPGYPASHGCIRLTGDFARLLWSTTKLGARVIVTHEEVAPVTFAHPRLFVPRSKPKNPLVAAIDSGTATDARADAALDRASQDPLAAAEKNLRAAALEANEALLTLQEEQRITMERRKGPISVFISRKTGKLYARQAFKPLFEMPVTIASPNQPIGSHVFIAMEAIEDDRAMRWTALSMPPERPKLDRNNRRDRDYSSRKRKPELLAPQPTPLPVSTAAEALDRIDIAQETRDRIAELLMPGASLVISDHGLGDETGEGTDFIVLTRS